METFLNFFQKNYFFDGCPTLPHFPTLPASPLYEGVVWEMRKICQPWVSGSILYQRKRELSVAEQGETRNKHGVSEKKSKRQEAYGLKMWKNETVERKLMSNASRNVWMMEMKYREWGRVSVHIQTLATWQRLLGARIHIIHSSYRPVQFSPLSLHYKLSTVYMTYIQT